MTMTIINDCDHYHRLPMPVYNDYDYDNYCTVAVFLIHLNIWGNIVGIRF